MIRTVLIGIDLKATALLKLIYLEMFGHDMSWAAFHVLEVMSSPKYIQKRVGYLGAVQSFRPDTEVLMLATNLLKKVNASTEIARGFRVDRFLGYKLCSTTYHFLASCDSSPRYHLFFSSFSSLGPSSQAVSFQSHYTQEDCGRSVQTCPGVSGHPAASLAKDQRPSHERRRRLERDRCCHQCSLRAWLETTKGFFTTSTSSI